jgi:hypothetical protein
MASGGSLADVALTSRSLVFSEKSGRLKMVIPSDAPALTKRAFSQLVAGGGPAA